jgi:hypothetical protein
MDTVERAPTFMTSLECSLSVSGTQAAKGVRMIRIELTAEEAEMLHECLENYFSDLRMEIAGTENMHFRESLKEKEAFLLRIIQQLKPA